MSLKYFSVLQPMMSHLNIFHGNMSDFVSFPLFGFTLVIKLRNFDFQALYKKMMSDLIMSYQAVADLA